MTLTQVCDVSYAMQAEQLDRIVSTERLASLLGGDGSLPSLLEAREMFDAALDAAFPKAVSIDRERSELMDALGLRHAG